MRIPAGGRGGRGRLAARRLVVAICGFVRLSCFGCYCRGGFIWVSVPDRRRDHKRDYSNDRSEDEDRQWAEEEFFGVHDHVKMGRGLRAVLVELRPMPQEALETLRCNSKITCGNLFKVSSGMVPLLRLLPAAVASRAFLSKALR